MLAKLNNIPILKLVSGG